MFRTLLISLLFLSLSGNAQYYFYNDKYYAGSITLEAGAAAGIMNSFTDLGGRRGVGGSFLKDLNWKVTRPSFGIYLLALFKEVMGLRLEISKGSVISFDSLLRHSDPDLIGRYGRNLSFKSKITEIQIAFEFHPLFLRSYDTDESPYLSPYLAFGIGYFKFNPRAWLNGRWYDLPPLRLEGQGFSEYLEHKRYSLQQFNIPLGFGIRYELGPAINVRIEVLHRFLFTDYLDDVSTSYIDPVYFSKYLSPEQAIVARQLYSRIQELQPGYTIGQNIPRGDQKDKDAFFTIQIKIGFALRAKR